MQLEDISFLTINSLISMPTPGLTQIISQVLISFIYVDILMTESWFQNFFDLIDPNISIDEPLN